MENKTLLKGDKVIMNNCYEATLDKYKDKIWTCKTDSYVAYSKQEVVFLEGFVGYFAVEFLSKIDDN